VCGRLIGRPGDGGITVDELAVEAICRVAQSCQFTLALPAHVKGDRRIDGRDRRIDRSDGVQDIGEVGETQIAHLHRRRAGAEICPDIVPRNRDGPKEPTGGDSRIEIMNLLVELTSEEVESDEAERAVARMAVLRDIVAVHEPHVGVEGQRGRRVGQGVRRGSGPVHLSRRDVTDEVGNRRYLLPEHREEEVEKWSRAEAEQSEHIGAARDRFRGGVPEKRTKRRERACWLDQPRAQRQTGGRGRTAHELAPRERTFPKVRVPDSPRSRGRRYDDATVVWNNRAQVRWIAMKMHANLHSYEFAHMAKSMPIPVRIGQILRRIQRFSKKL